MKKGQVNRTVKYADGLVLLARKEKVPHGMNDSVIEIGRYYTMEMNVEKLRQKVSQGNDMPSPHYRIL
jgi:hypothetical protein